MPKQISARAILDVIQKVLSAKNVWSVKQTDTSAKVGLSTSCISILLASGLSTKHTSTSVNAPVPIHTHVSASIDLVEKPIVTSAIAEFFVKHKLTDIAFASVEITTNNANNKNFFIIVILLFLCGLEVFGFDWFVFFYCSVLQIDVVQGKGDRVVVRIKSYLCF